MNARTIDNLKEFTKFCKLFSTQKKHEKRVCYSALRKQHISTINALYLCWDYVLAALALFEKCTYKSKAILNRHFCESTEFVNFDEYFYKKINKATSPSQVYEILSNYLAEIEEKIVMFLETDKQTKEIVGMGYCKMKNWESEATEKPGRQLIKRTWSGENYYVSLDYYNDVMKACYENWIAKGQNKND